MVLTKHLVSVALDLVVCILANFAWSTLDMLILVGVACRRTWVSPWMVRLADNGTLWQHSNLLSKRDESSNLWHLDNHFTVQIFFPKDLLDLLVSHHITSWGIDVIILSYLGEHVGFDAGQLLSQCTNVLHQIDEKLAALLAGDHTILLRLHLNASTLIVLELHGLLVVHSEVDDLSILFF